MSRLLTQIETILTLKPNSCVISKKFTSGTPKEQNENSINNLLKDGARSEDMNGYLSDASRRTLKGLCENFLMAVELKTNMAYGHSSGVYPTFITLTLPSKQLHHDKLIKDNCLGAFIEWLKNENTYITQKGKSKGLQQGCNVKSYVWRAESQKDGNIHFHIICDRWIDKDQIRWKWNSLVERLGYVTRFRWKQEFIYKSGFRVLKDEFIETKKKIKKKLYAAKTYGTMPNNLSQAAEKIFIDAIHCKNGFGLRELNKIATEILRTAYQKKVDNNFSDPPSTQVIPVANAKSVSAYITKYIAKPNQKLEVILKAGQEMLTVQNPFNGKEERFIVTYKIEKDLEGNDIKFEQSRQEYKPKYDVRKLSGRLYGRSDILKENAKPYKVVAYTAQIIEEDVVSNYTIKRNVAQYHIDIFGVSNFVGYKKISEICSTTETQKRIISIENKVAWGYIDTLRGIIGKDEIAAATAKVGGSFVDFGGEIIPVYHKNADNSVKYQKHFLKENSPELWRNYQNHYDNIFTEIYGNS